MFDINLMIGLATGYIMGIACVAILLPIFKQSYKTLGKTELVHHLWMWNPMAAKEFGEWIIRVDPDGF